MANESVPSLIPLREGGVSTGVLMDEEEAGKRPDDVGVILFDEFGIFFLFILS